LIEVNVKISIQNYNNCFVSDAISVSNTEGHSRRE